MTSVPDRHEKVGWVGRDSPSEPGSCLWAAGPMQQLSTSVGVWAWSIQDLQVGQQFSVCTAASGTWRQRGVRKVKLGERGKCRNRKELRYPRGEAGKYKREKRGEKKFLREKSGRIGYQAGQ